MKSLKKKVAEAVYKGIKTVSPDAEITADEITTYLAYPPDANMGDLALPCFKFAKQLRLPPPVIAAKLAEVFECEGIERAEVAGGYLNFRIDRASFCKRIYGDITKSEKPYGATGEG